MRSAQAPSPVRFALQRLNLSGLQWGDPWPDARPVLALHGWLDNAASFAWLGPGLGEKRPCIAVDLPGHGLSDHRPPGAAYTLIDSVQDLADLITRHFTRAPILVGHSLGGIIASLFAAAMPERVHALVLIDSLGPYVSAEEEAPKRLRRGLKAALKAERGSLPAYASPEEAIRARQEGPLALSPEAARLIVTRNLRPCEGGWTWRTDRRLRDPSPLMLSERQVQGFLGGIEAPTLLIRGDPGMLPRDERMKARAACIRGLREVTVSGSHHCHLDGDLDAILETIEAFLE